MKTDLPMIWYVRLFFLMTLMGVLDCSAQHFKLLDISSGLSNNSINCIEQDTKGMLWFGTYDGLCMFDGVNFSTFRHDSKDPYALPDNFVTALSRAPNGLWVGTRMGLRFFSFTDFRFYPCNLTAANGKGQAPVSGFIRSIVQTDSGWIVMSADEGLLWSKGGTTFSAATFGLPATSWLRIAPYKKSKFLAHGYAGLFVLDAATMKVTGQYLYDINQPVDAIYYSSYANRIFIGSGITKPTTAFRDSAGILSPVSMNLPSGVKAVTDYTLPGTGEKVVLFGTDGNGLLATDKSGAIRKQWAPGNSNISSDAVSTLFCDDAANLWAGTFRGGVNLFDPASVFFNNISTANSPLSHNVVTALFKMNGRFYIGTDGGGFNVADADFSKMNTFNSANSNLPGNNVLSITGDGTNVWLGIYGGGIARFDPRNKTFRNYELPAVANNVSERNMVWVLKDDQKGNLWIGAKTGVFRFNKAKETFDIIQTEVNDVSALAATPSGIWVSTNGRGLFELDRDGKILSTINTGNYPELVNNNVHYLHVAANGLVWFGTEHNGLFRFDPVKRKLKQYGKTEGFLNPNVIGIAEDRTGNLWVSSHNGLYRFNPITEAFVRFGKEDHLPALQFNYNAVYSDEKQLFFGCTKGLVFFTPADISKKQTHKRIVFTDFKLLNEDNKRVPYADAAATTIRLPYNQNFFTISFAAPEMLSPDKIRYSYYLESFEKGWNEPAQKRQVTYTNVPPGEYIFKVKATNINGDWNPSFSSLKLIIDPPWWRTGWATALFVLSGIALLTGGFLFYRHDLKMKHTVELKEMEGNAEKGLHEAKLTFLTNISHELRTPVFLLKAPLEELMSAKAKSIQISKANLQAMYKNANRLHKLINRIIDFRKLETGNLTLSLKEADVVAFCRELTEDFEPLCQQKDILLLFETNRKEVMLQFDSEKLESVLSNLITNAFKYSPNGSRIVVALEEQQDRVCFRVQDNGYGIHKDHISSIFDQFFQVKVDEHVAMGDGIGLTFVKSLVELHGGSVTVESELKKGSVFSFYLPKKPVMVNAMEMADVSMKPENDEPETAGPDERAVVAVPETEAPVPVYQNPAAAHSLLIVDDEPGVLELIKRIFGHHFRIITASDGISGLEMLRQHLPDIVISDIMMPRMNGIEFLRQLRTEKQFDHIPVVVLSAKSSEEETLRVYGMGADAFLPKPVSIQFLKQRVQQLIEQPRQRPMAHLANGHGKYTREEKVFLQKCEEIITRNIDDSSFNVAFFARELGMSHSSLYKKLKTVTGMSIIEFVNANRIYWALQLFNEGETNISQVSARCGFNDIKNFREAFKQRVGVSPSVYLQHGAEHPDEKSPDNSEKEVS